MSISTIEEETINEIKLLASLSAVFLDRFKFEKVYEHLLISEEQNRIASEIHDSVSQLLFSISCKLHTLIQDTGITAEVKAELFLIRNSLNRAMKELREAIYSLSRKGSEQSVLESDIKNYIDDVSRLNNVGISFDIVGNQELINCDLKKAVYRIICETTGNAIRHGNCSLINILLNIEKECIKLIIEDNGIGFDLKSKISNKEMGLGINNIYNMVYSMNGEINIESQTGKGTSVYILLPNSLLSYKEQGEVV